MAISNSASAKDKLLALRFQNSDFRALTFVDCMNPRYECVKAVLMIVTANILGKFSVIGGV